MQVFEQTSGQRFVDPADAGVVLDGLPGYIQGQVFGVHHPFHKTQVVRQQVFVVFLDEDILGVKLQTVIVAQPQGPGLAAAGHEQQGVDIDRDIRDHMDMQQRFIRIEGQLAVKISVSGLVDLLWGLPPEGGTLVGSFLLDINWERDVIGVLFDDRFQPPGGSVLGRGLQELDLNRRPAFGLIRREEVVGVLPARTPGPASSSGRKEREVTVTSSATIKTE